MLYQPFDSQNKVDGSNNFALTSNLDLNCGFAGNAGNSLNLRQMVRTTLQLVQYLLELLRHWKV